MLTARPVKKQFGGYLCRRCMNRQYNVRLKPRDVRYRSGNLCPLCRSTDHLVKGFTFTGLYKMFWKFK